MRRARRPLLLLILIVGGLAGALPVALLAHRSLRALSISPDRWVGPGILAAVLVLDLLFRRFGRPRPFAANRQVPRHWGHDLGPWWAAARYAPRLGVGPATILTSWTWWGMLAASATGGWRWSLVASAIFVCVRSIVTIAVAWDVVDGVGMARRLAGVQSFAQRAASGSSLLLSASLLASALRLWRYR